MNFARVTPNSPYADRLLLAHAVTTRIEANPEAPTPLWLADQNEAAIIDARSLLDQLGDLRNAETGGTQKTYLWPLTPAAEARWLATEMGCRPCPHIVGVDTPQLMVADCRCKRLACRRCLRTVRKTVGLDRCQACDATGVTEFRTVSFAHGYIIVVAAIGPCCFDIVPELRVGS